MIAVLDSWLCAGDTGLEFGSGRSTRWFAARVGALTSIEHDAAWHARVASSLVDRLTGEQQHRLRRHDTENSEAYVAQLKARFFANRPSL